jgi:hypothetical protein
VIFPGVRIFRLIPFPTRMTGQLEWVAKRIPRFMYFENLIIVMCIQFYKIKKLANWGDLPRPGVD